MSVYQEFAEDIERRQRRLARQQFWRLANGELKRTNFLWTGMFLLIFAGAIAAVIAKGLGWM